MKTTAEVAELFRCSPRKVRKMAAELGLGIDLGGRAGFRYTDADIAALEQDMRPAAPVTVTRRRRRAS